MEMNVKLNDKNLVALGDSSALGDEMGMSTPGMMSVAHTSFKLEMLSLEPLQNLFKTVKIA